jgi:hypothetical protein
VGYQLIFNPDGSLQTTEEFPRLDSPGTIIEVRQLFHTLVVRRQRAESQASKGKELETVNKYIIELAVIHPEVKFNLKAPPGKELKLSILSQQTPLVIYFCSSFSLLPMLSSLLLFSLSFLPTSFSCTYSLRLDSKTSTDLHHAVFFKKR